MPMNDRRRASPPRVAVIGAGPAGLMAAEALSAAGVRVDVFEGMPTAGRKLLMAGRGGLNMTHVEPSPAFAARYREQADSVGRWLADFDGTAVRAWAEGLGIATFVGSSGKVFPVGMKAAPLLRAWLRRLHEAAVTMHVRHRWCGWAASGEAVFDTPDGVRRIDADAYVLALGGASWARLGSDGAWAAVLAKHGVPLAPFKPANCGVEIAWSEVFRERFAGQPLKAVRIAFTDIDGQAQQRGGECLVTRHGLQGPLVYALSASLRDALAQGPLTIHLDLAPDRDRDSLVACLSRPRASRSLSAHWQRGIGLKGIKAGLLREALSKDALNDAERVADTLKALPLTITATRPLDEAISTAGGVMFAGLTPELMLKDRPGVFVAGEMLDWEAPTGGYLLTACFASGRWAARGALQWLATTGEKVD